MELVSVIVPVYKVEQYLEKCVKSIQNQTYQNLEIILVDDGSPDKCGKMCDAFAKKDERIRVIHKPNGGLSDARNAGVPLATGKYLLFVDSDDYIELSLIEKAVNVAEKNSCDIVLFDHFHVENGEPEIRRNGVPSGRPLNVKECPKLLLAAPSAWSKLFNREFYNRTNISFPKGLYYEDLGTTPKLFFEADKIMYLDEPLYYYMIRGNSIMGSKNFERNYRDKIKILNDIIEFYQRNGAFEEYYQELEYLVFANAYFGPSREIVLSKEGTEYLEKYRNYMYQKFPHFANNKYIKQMGKKNRLHMYVLNTRQYWIMRLLSKCRKAAEKIRK